MQLNINKKIQTWLLIIIFSILKLKSIGQINNKVELINATYLGNYERNYYGNIAPEKLS